MCGGVLGVLQLCEVFLLEGLGPAKGETALVWMDESSPFISARSRGSFADAVSERPVGGPRHAPWLALLAQGSALQAQLCMKNQESQSISTTLYGTPDEYTYAVHYQIVLYAGCAGQL